VELAKLVDEDVPESLVSAEMQNRLQNLAYQLQGRGIALDDYHQITGRDPESFTAELKEAADEAVRVDLALRAVAVAEGLEATDEQVDAEILQLIGDADIELDEARDQLRSGGQLSAVRSDVSNRNALEWLVDHSEVVDPDGNAIPEEYLKLPEEPEHDHAGHDHDHDHAGHDHDHDHDH
jgi:trigger factor